MSRVHADPRALRVVGAGAALPGPLVSNAALVARIEARFGVALRRSGLAVARRLAIDSRHICRDFAERTEGPRAGDGPADLAAKAVQRALKEAGRAPSDLSYLIGHTATPLQPLPPNVAAVADLLGYDGPFAEFRQACTGFASALVMAQGLLQGPGGGLVAIVGSETGSVFFDPFRAAQDRGQLVNLMQMGDGAGAVVLAPDDGRPGARLSCNFAGQVGLGRSPGLRMAGGGAAAPAAAGAALEFEHDFAAIRDAGLDLFTHGAQALRAAGLEPRAADWVIPHQANGRMAELVSAHLGLEPERVFVTAREVGNTGSAAIWLALAALRPRLKAGDSVAVLGAEATKYMFGGFHYVHG